MVTMHQSDELSESSARTSERGIRIVKALIQFENEENKAENSNSVKSNVQAILKVANRKTTNDVLVKEEAAEYSNKLIKVSDSVLSLWPYANNAEMESDHAIDSIFWSHLDTTLSVNDNMTIQHLLRLNRWQNLPKF